MDDMHSAPTLRNFAGPLILVCSLLFSHAIADELSGALDAFNKGQYANALQMWQSLSAKGNAASLFNIAYMQQNGIGVRRDEDEANRLIQQAARARLVDAYNRVQANSIRPASLQDAMKAQQVLDPQAWVKSQNPRHYTLQLASSRSRKLIEKYYQENQLQGKAGFYKSRRQGEYWYALVYGAYPSVGEANDAIAVLPEDLRKWSPWVRRIDSIHKITTP